MLASAMRTTASALESTWHKEDMPVAMTNTRFFPHFFHPVRT
jgi:hypothetical protein